jgi:hypothetical protein
MINIATKNAGLEQHIWEHWQKSSLTVLLDMPALGNIRTQTEACSIASFENQTQELAKFNLTCSIGAKLTNLTDFGSIPSSHVVKCPGMFDR